MLTAAGPEGDDADRPDGDHDDRRDRHLGERAHGWEPPRHARGAPLWDRGERGQDGGKHRPRRVVGVVLEPVRDAGLEVGIDGQSAHAGRSLDVA